MVNIASIVIMAQWGIILLFTTLHFLLGLKRGVTKSLYYAVTSLIITALSIFAITFISVRSFINADFVVRGYEFLLNTQIPSQYREILVDPSMNGIIIGIVDLVLKLIAFFIIYPIIKLVLTHTLFKGIYRFFEKNSLNKVEFTKSPLSPNKIEIKKKNKTFSRLSGGLIGFTRGFLTAWLLLMPLLILTSAVKINPNLVQTSTTEDGSNSQAGALIDDISKLLSEINEKGFGKYSSQIIVNDQQLEVALFDYLFTVKVKNLEDELYELQLGSELQRIGQIVSVLINDGYLNSDFDYEAINYDQHYAGIDNILTQLGRSDLLNILLPIAIEIGAEYPLVTQNLGFNLTENVKTAPLLAKLKKLNLENEMNSLSLTIRELLQVSNVGEFLILLEDPEALLELENEKLRHFGSALNEISKMELLAASSIALEYALMQESIINRISWTEDAELYLREKLEFLYQEGFVQAEIDRLGNLIQAVFGSEFDDFDYQSLIPQSEFDAGIYLTEDTRALVEVFLRELVEIETILRMIPLAVDFTLYTSNQEIVQNLADEISQAFDKEQKVIKDEIGHVESIYEYLVSMGINRLFNDDEQLIEVIDAILLAEGNFDNAKAIISVLFEESHIINEVLHIVAEPLLEQVINDEEILELVLSTINEEGFLYGKEFITVLNLTESVYQFTNISEVLERIEYKEYVQLLASFGQLSNLQYNELKTHLFNLQLLNSSYEIVDLLKNKAQIEQLVLPESANKESIKSDITLALDLWYEISNHIHVNNLDVYFINDLNLLELIPYQKVKQLLLFDEEKDADSIILSSLVNYLQTTSLSFGDLGEISLPNDFSIAEYNSSIWVNEINNIIQGVLDAAETINNEEVINLSFNYINGLNSLNDLPIDLITMFEAEEKVDLVFGKITDSTLLKYNGVTIIKEMISQIEGIPTIELDDDLYKQESLTSENLTELLKIATQLFIKTIDDHALSLGEHIKKLNSSSILTVFNSLDEEFINRIGYQTTINNAFRSLVMNPTIHDELYNLINNTITFEHFTPINSGLFDLRAALDEENKLKEETLALMLMFARNLNLPDDFLQVTANEQLNIILNEVNDDLIDDLLEIKLIHELLSNAVLLDSVYSLGEAYFEIGVEALNNQNMNVTVSYNDYYITVINALIANDGLIDATEIKNYVKIGFTISGYKLDLSQALNESYNLITDEIFRVRYLGKNLVDHISETVLLRGLLKTLFNDEELLQSIAVIINNAFVVNGEQLANINYENLLLDQTLFDDEGLQRKHTHDLLTAVLKQDLDLIRRRQITIADLENLINEEKDISKLQYLYNSRVIESTIYSTIESDSVKDLIIDLANPYVSQVTAQIGISNFELSNEDVRLKNEHFNYEATKQTIYALTQLNINSLGELGQIRSLADVRIVLDIENTREIIDEITAIPLLIELYRTTAQNEKLAGLLADVVDVQLIQRFKLPLSKPSIQAFYLEDKYINQQDFSDLLIAFLGVNIDIDSQFSNPNLIKDLLEPITIVGVEQNSILHLLNSNVIHSAIDKAIQNEQLRVMIATEVNRALSPYNLGVVFSSEHFTIPKVALNEEGRINPDEFVTLVEAFTELNLSSYGELGTITEINNLRRIVPIEFYEKLFESEFIHYTIDKLIQSDETKQMIVNFISQQVNGDYLDESILDIPNHLLDNKKRVKVDDLIVVIESAYMTELERFSISVNNPSDIEVIVPLNSLEHLLSSDLVKFGITRLTQSEQSRALLANIANDQLRARNLNSTEFTANDFLLPNHLLDFSGYIKTKDILIFTETFYSLGIDSFNNIPLNNPKAIENILSVDNLELLLKSELAKYGITKLTQSEQSRKLLADLANDQLRVRNLNSTFNATDFLLPTHLLDLSGYIKTEDILILVESFYNLGLNSFNNIPLNSPKAIENILSLENLDHLLTSELVKYSITKLTQSKQSRELLADLVNNQLNARNISESQIKADDFLLPTHLLDIHGYIKTEDIMLLSETFYNLGISSFSSIPLNNPKAIEKIIGIDLLTPLIYETDLIHYYLDKVAQSRLVREQLARFINQNASANKIDINLTSEQLSIPAEALLNGQILKSDIIDLVSVFYQLGIDNFNNIPLTGPKQIERIMGLDLFDQLLAIEVVYHVANKTIMSNAVKVAMASAINSQLSQFNLSVTLKSEDIKIPENALVDGMISKSELSKLLEILYELKVDTFAELGQTRSINQIKAIVDQEYFDLLLESEMIYYLTGYVTQTARVRDQLAQQFAKIVKSSLGIEMELLGEDFLFNQHDVVISNGDYKGYIRKDELKQFYNSFLIVDINKIRGPSFEQSIHLLTSELLTDYEDHLLIDEVLESNMILTIFDRVLNLEQNERIQTGVLAYLSDFVERAGYGTVTFRTDDRIFKYHESALTPEGYVSKEEMVRLVISINQVDLGNPNIRMLTDLIDRNLDETDKDDFDRLYESVIIQSIISNMMLNDRFVSGAARILNDRQNHFEFTLEILAIPDEVVYEGVILPVEIKQLVKTFIILDVYEVDPSIISIKLFTDLLGQNTAGATDDLDRFLESYIIFSLIDRVVKSDSFNKFVTRQANQALNENVNSVNTSLTNDMLDENDMFAKAEIRSLLTSIKLLGVESFGDVRRVGLFDLLLLDNENDDLDLFFDSNYIRVMVSRMLTSRTIKTRIANSAGFEVENFDLGSTERDVDNNLTKAEVKNVFIALNTLNITDFNNISLTNTTLKGLSDDELEIVLDSNFFYQVIDLKLKHELTDKVTDESIVNDLDDKHYGYIKKTEIKGLIEALDILEIDGTDDIDVNNLSINQLEQLIAIDSYILRILISDAIKEHIDVPEASLDLNSVIIKSELENLLSALRVLFPDGETAIGQLDMTSMAVTTFQFNALLNIDDGSPIVIRLISEKVIEAFGDRIDERAFSDSDQKDIKYEELEFLRNALFELEIDEITGDLNLENVSVYNIHNIHLYDSLILNRLISDEIITAVGTNVPTAAYDEDMVEYSEVGRLLSALGWLNKPISGLTDLDTQILTFTTIELAIQEESLIIDRYISNGLIDEDEIKTDRALDDDGHVDKDEMTRFITAINAIDGVNTINDFVEFLENVDDPSEIAPYAVTDSIILEDTVIAKIEQLLGL